MGSRSARTTRASWAPLGRFDRGEGLLRLRGGAVDIGEFLRLGRRCRKERNCASDNQERLRDRVTFELPDLEVVRLFLSKSRSKLRQHGERSAEAFPNQPVGRKFVARILAGWTASQVGGARSSGCGDPGCCRSGASLGDVQRRPEERGGQPGRAR